MWVNQDLELTVTRYPMLILIRRNRSTNKFFFLFQLRAILFFFRTADWRPCFYCSFLMSYFSFHKKPTKITKRSNASYIMKYCTPINIRSPLTDKGSRASKPTRIWTATVYSEHLRSTEPSIKTKTKNVIESRTGSRDLLMSASKGRAKCVDKRVKEREHRHRDERRVSSWSSIFVIYETSSSR